MKVRCSFTTALGEPFSWDFQLEENDPNRAIDEAILLFFSGLTLSEREEAIKTLDVIAHPTVLPALRHASKLSTT
jgi:hypothetical protein